MFCHTRTGLLCTIAIVSLNQHDFFGDIVSLLGCAETQRTTESRIGLLVAVSDTHAASCGDVEPCQITVFIHDRDEADIVGKHVNVIARWHSHGNLKLRRLELGTLRVNERADLPREVVLPVQWFEVLHGFPRHEFLIQPYLVICRRPGEQSFT